MKIIGAIAIGTVIFIIAKGLFQGIMPEFYAGYFTGISVTAWFSLYFYVIAKK